MRMVINDILFPPMGQATTTTARFFLRARVRVRARELSTIDKDVLKRIEDIEKVDENTRKHLFFLIDNVIQNYKTKLAFA